MEILLIVYHFKLAQMMADTGPTFQEIDIEVKKHIQDLIQEQIKKKKEEQK